MCLVLVTDNLQSIAIALVIMDPVYPNDKNSGHGWITSVASSVVFAGCVCGQLVLGLLGDVLGRCGGVPLFL